MSARVTRKLHPRTGHIVLQGGRWVRGVPMLEVVLRVLRTSKGDYPPDPSFGVDYGSVDKGAPNAAAALKLAIEEALAPYTRTRQIQMLSVDVQRAGDRLVYDVAFVDPRAEASARQQSIRGMY